MNPRLLPWLFALVALVGCASASAPSASTPPSRVRCLADPGERETRPLIFLFCIQSP